MTDLNLEETKAQIFTPGWLSGGPETLDGINDILTNKQLWIAGYGPNFVRNRAIDNSKVEMPNTNWEIARKIADGMSKTGAPAIFAPVLATTDVPNLFGRENVAFGLCGLPGQEKTTITAYLAYITGSKILILDSFYPGFTASEYLIWLTEAKPNSYAQAREIIFAHLPKWLQEKKLGKTTVGGKDKVVRPFFDVLKEGFDKYITSSSGSNWLMVDLPGLPRVNDWYQANRPINPFDLAATSCEIFLEAPEVDKEIWVQELLKDLNSRKFTEAQIKRQNLIKKLRSGGN